MAQKKTSAGRSGTKKPASTARKGTTTKKKTTSSRSGTTAKKKAPARGGSSRAASGSRSSARAKTPPRQPVRRQVGGVVLLILGIVAAIGYFPANAWLVAAIRRLVMGFFGWGFYIAPVCLLWGAYILSFHRGRPIQARLVSVLLLPLVFGAFIHALAFSESRTIFAGINALDSLKNGFAQLWTLGSDMTEHCGGVFGGIVGLALKKSIGVVGSFLVLVVAFGFLVLEGLDLSVVELIDRFKARPRLEYEPEPEPEPDEEEMFDPEEDYPFPLNRSGRREEPVPPPQPAPPAKKPARRRSFYDQNREEAKDELFAQFDVDPADTAKVAAALEAEQAQKAKRPAPAPRPEPVPPQPAPKIAPKKTERAPVQPVTVEEAAEIAGVQIHSADMDQGAAAPVEKLKIDKDAEAAAVAREIEEKAREEEDKPAYIFPDVELLNRSGDESYDADGDLDETAEQLESAIRSFGVAASVTGAVYGPTITRYELKLDQGVKLNKITNLAGDIALSLGVVSVRIAPIPDKISTVGVEVPNKTVRTVWLGDLIDSDTFRNAKNKLSVALGKDIGGNIIVGNIAKMPHVLIAGTTGSGKSVCINSLILSILYKATPDEVRMIMIDPKMVELGIYNGMPHLYVPVVTDPKKAAGALQWSVVEMLKRYRLFSESGVRDLAGYNAIQQKHGEDTLPQVVIIIDELADLMMVASKEVEESICRVAQMGRAAGMHLVVATQRPSADVITGLMKANIPSRIAFAVSSALESRIILDQQGAEKLVGAGDMLYSPIGSKPMRVQGAFVTDEEREEIINFVKKEAEAEYSDEILAQIEKAAEDKDAKSGAAEEESAEKSDYDELLPQAVEVIFETKQASVSMLQRRLKLGYSRAARLIDQLEEVGVVGPYEGSKPRKIMLTKQQWQEMQYAQGTAPVDTITHEFAQLSEDDQFAPTDEQTGMDDADDDTPPFDMDEDMDADDGGEEELL